MALLGLTLTPIPCFKEHYDKIAHGAAEFLRDAVWSWLG
jgi:hypothetical protein